MKTEIGEKKNIFRIENINFILLVIFTLANNMDYFSTYLSILDGGIEVNPIVVIMLEYPLVFFIWKILVLPLIIWYFAYDSESKKVMWSLVVIDLVYLLVVCWLFGVILE